MPQEPEPCKSAARIVVRRYAIRASDRGPSFARCAKLHMRLHRQPLKLAALLNVVTEFQRSLPQFPRTATPVEMVYRAPMADS